MCPVTGNMMSWQICRGHEWKAVISLVVDTTVGMPSCELAFDSWSQKMSPRALSLGH